jgi:hypothetical protein
MSKPTRRRTQAPRQSQVVLPHNPPPRAMSETELREMMNEEISKRIAPPRTEKVAARTLNTVTEMPGGVKLEQVCPACGNGARLKPCPACNPTTTKKNHSPERCRVPGCMAVRDQPYAGTPMCQQAWAGEPTAHRQYLDACMMRQPSETVDRTEPFPDAQSGAAPSTQAEIQAVTGFIPSPEPHKRDEPTAFLPAGETRTSNVTPSVEDIEPGHDQAVSENDPALARMLECLQKLQSPQPMTEEQMDKVLAANGIPPAPAREPQKSAETAPARVAAEKALPSSASPVPPPMPAEAGWGEAAVSLAYLGLCVLAGGFLGGAGIIFGGWTALEAIPLLKALLSP